MILPLGNQPHSASEHIPPVMPLTSASTLYNISILRTSGSSFGALESIVPVGPNAGNGAYAQISPVTFDASNSIMYSLSGHYQSNLRSNLTPDSFSSSTPIGTTYNNTGILAAPNGIMYVMGVQSNSNYNGYISFRYASNLTFISSENMAVSDPGQTGTFGSVPPAAAESLAWDPNGSVVFGAMSGGPIDVYFNTTGKYCIDNLNGIPVLASANGVLFEEWDVFSIAAGKNFTYARVDLYSLNSLDFSGIVVLNATGAEITSFGFSGHITDMFYYPPLHHMIGLVYGLSQPGVAGTAPRIVEFNRTGILRTWSLPSQNNIAMAAAFGYVWVTNGGTTLYALNLTTNATASYFVPYDVTGLSWDPHDGRLYVLSSHHVVEIFQPPPWPATFQQSGLPGFDSWTIHLTNSSSTIMKALHSSSLYGLWLGGIYSANATTPDPRYGALDEQIDVSAVSAYDMSFRMLSVTESASALGQSSMIPAAPTTGVYLLIAYNTSSGRIYQYLPASQLSQYNSGYEDATWDVSIPSNATYIEVQGQPSWISPYASLPYQAGSSSISILQDPSSFMISWLVPHSSSGSGGSPGSNGSAPANAATGIWALLGFTVNPPASSLSGDAIYLLSAESGRGMYLIVALLAILYYLVALRKKLQEKHPAGGRR